MKSKLEKMLAERELPPIVGDDNRSFSTREEWEAVRPAVRRAIQEKIYGTLPPPPDEFSVQAETPSPFCAGKATLQKLVFTVRCGAQTASFPVFAVLPVRRPPAGAPAFVHINFRPDVPDRYMPSEEIVDRGYAVFSFCYRDVAGDDGDFRSGCARALSSSRRKSDAPGKIAMWAWAAMRVMDYIQTLPAGVVRTDLVAVVGHSRLGKTALLTGALDERFRFVISNDSGCSGAALTRGKIGETQKNITDRFPYWFCPRYVRQGQKGEICSIDQNYLTSLIPPRQLMVGSAWEDDWADPVSEYLNTVCTNRIYALYGMRGLVHKDAVPRGAVRLSAGDAHYHLRMGTHYLSREDWNAYMDFIDRYVSAPSGENPGASKGV